MVLTSFLWLEYCNFQDVDFSRDSICAWGVYQSHKWKYGVFIFRNTFFYRNPVVCWFLLHCFAWLYNVSIDIVAKWVAFSLVFVRYNSRPTFFLDLKSWLIPRNIKTKEFSLFKIEFMYKIVYKFNFKWIKFSIFFSFNFRAFIGVKIFPASYIFPTSEINNHYQTLWLGSW